MRYWYGVVVALCCLVLIGGCGEHENKNVVKAKRLIAEGDDANAVSELEMALNSEPEHAEAQCMQDILQARSGSLSWPNAVEQVAQHIQPVFDEIADLESREDLDDDDYKQLDRLILQRNYSLGLLASNIASVIGKDSGLSTSLPAGVTTRLMLTASRCYTPANRQAALKVIRAINDTDSLVDVARSMDEHASVREQAIELLAEIQQEAALDLLEEIASNPGEPFPVAHSLVLAASKIGGEQTIPLLRKLLRMEATQARLFAAAMLGRLRATETIPELIYLLADNSAYVRNHVQDVLIGMGASSVPPLIQLLSEHAENVPLPASAQISEDTIKARQNVIQTHAMNILAALKSEEVLPILIENLQDIDLSGGASIALTSMGAAAVPTLIETLKTGEDQLRIQAASILAGIGDLRAVESLIQALTDPHKDVRANAALGLGNMKARGQNDSAVYALLAVMDGDERTKTNALNALKDIGVTNQEIDSRLTEIVGDRNERQSVRLAALGAMTTLKPMEAAPVLVNLLLADDENDTIRKSAATALGEIKHPDTLPTLLWIAGTLKEEIKDFQREMKRRYGTIAEFNAAVQGLFTGEIAGNKEFYTPYYNWNEIKPIPSLIRGEVMISLGKIKGDEVIEPLIKVLEDDQRAAVRSSAAWALGEIKGDKVISPLIRALKKDKQGIVRSRAAEALGKIKGEKVIDPLVDTLKHDKFENARLKTAIGLREIKFDKAARGLVSALKGEGDAYEEKEVDTVLNEIMIALEKDGSVAVPALLTAVNSEDVMVRKRAINSLGIIADKSAYDAMLAALDDENVIVRERAAARIGALKERKAVPRLIEVLNDPDEWSAVRAGAASSLGTLRDEQASDTLLAALGSEDILIRSAAASALGSLKEARAAEQLLKVETDPTNDPDLRVRAVSSLASIGYRQAGPNLIELLDTETGTLYDNTIAALGTLEVQQAVPKLNAILLDPTETELARRNAATALAKIKDGSSVSALASVLTDPTEYRIIVIDSIKRNLLFEDVANATRSFTMPTTIVPKMLERIDDPWEHHTVHWGAAISLSRTGSKQALARVEKAAREDGHVDVRNIASRSLGETQLREYTQLLLDFSGSSDYAHGHRRGATQGLGYLGDPAAVPYLIQLLNDTSAHEELRRDAAVALGRIGTLDAAKALESALAQDGWSKALRLDIITGIKLAASNTAVNVLKQILDDEDADIHFRTADALYTITGDGQGYHRM